MVEVVKSATFDENSKIGEQRYASRCASTGSPLATPPTSSRAAGGFSELRIDYGPGYRVYYQRLIVLLCGGEKSGQQHDIEQAKRIAAEWENR